MWTGGIGKSLKVESGYAPNIEMYFFDAFRLRHLISVPSIFLAEMFLLQRCINELQGILINTNSTDVWKKFLHLKFCSKEFTFSAAWPSGNDLLYDMRSVLFEADWGQGPLVLAILKTPTTSCHLLVIS